MARRSNGSMERPFGSVGPNPINIPIKSATALIDLLNQDLSAHFILFHQYQKHHWVTEGPQFFELHVLLEKFYTEIHEHADAIAERIVTLGGVPASGPAQQIEMSYIEHEPEGIFDLRAMLQRDMEAEGLMAETLRGHIAEARRQRDYGTEDLLNVALRASELRAAFLAKHLFKESLDQTYARDE